MDVHDEGVVMHLTPYSETSLVVVWLTRDHGILRTLARGARRPRPGAGRAVDILRAGHLAFVPSRTSRLHTLKEFVPEPGGLPLGGDYARQVAALYFYEVVARLVEPQAPIPELYALYRRALAYLETHPASRAVVEHFERRVFEMMGLYQPGMSPAALRARLLHPLPRTWRALRQTWDIGAE